MRNIVFLFLLSFFLIGFASKPVIAQSGRYGNLDQYSVDNVTTENISGSSISVSRKLFYTAGLYGSLKSAITAAGNDTSILVVDHGIYHITQASRDTVPSTVTLSVGQGSGISPTRLLTIYGHLVDPGSIQIFYGNKDSVEFMPGSVDFVRPEWFGACGTDTSDDIQGFRSAVNSFTKLARTGNQIKFFVSPGIFYFSDSLLITESGITFDWPGLIRPYGNYSGYLLHIKSTIPIEDNGRNTVFATGQAWFPKIIIEQMWLDGEGKSKGVFFELLDHIKINSLFITRNYGAGARFSNVRESTIMNLTINSGNAGTDSANLVLNEPGGGDDANNVLLFYGFVSAYNGGRAIYISSGTTANEAREIQFFGAQIHYLDIGTSYAVLDSNITLIKIGKANHINFFGCNLRVGMNAKNGRIFDIGIDGVSPYEATYVGVWGGRLSGEGTNALAVYMRNANYVWFDGQDISVPRIYDGIDSLNIVKRNIFVRQEYKATQNKVMLKLLNDSGVNSPQLQFAGNSSNTSTVLYREVESQVIAVKDSFGIDMNFVLSGSDRSIALSNSDSLLKIGKPQRRLEKAIFYPKTIPTSIENQGQINYFASGVQAWGEGFYEYNGSEYFPLGENPGGNNTFSGSAISDTVLVALGTANSVYIVSIRDSFPIINDLLSYTAKTDTLIVHRTAGTTSNLAYSWALIRR